MIINSNRESTDQLNSADSSINNSAKNGKSISAIAPLINLEEAEEIDFDKITSWQPPQTQIILPKLNSDKNEEELEYIRSLVSSESLNTREQVKLFLEALNFRQQDRIYIRCIPAKKIPSEKLLEWGLGFETKESKNSKAENKKVVVVNKTIKGYIEWDDEEEDYSFYENRSNKEPQKHTWGIQKLQELNKKGYGIYFVVGQGGDNDGAISKVETLFYECDGIDKDKQWEKQRKLSRDYKLTPIAIVETRNSIHVYYRREDNNDYSARTFRGFQQRLIQLADSDPAIHNEARLMRLPGFDHVKYNDGILEFIPCTLKLCDFNAPHYSDDDFNETLPKWDEKRWSKKKKSNNSLDAHNIKNFSQSVANNGYLSDANNIKNFAPYLIAGEVRKGGIETYQCPAHNATANNSLHIFPNGAFKPWCGCDTHDVWRAARDIAVANGYVLPERKQDYQKTKEEYFADFEQKRKEVAQFSFTREANILVNEGYFPDIKLKDLPQGLIGIKGDWGTGKSHLIASLIKQYAYNKVIQIGHLNSLLFNTSKKYGLTHHHVAEKQTWGLLGCDRLAITDISVGSKLKIEHYSNQRLFLVLDEIEQILNSLANNKNLKGTLRLEYFSKLVWLIRNAEYIIFADADLSDTTLEFIEAIRNAEKGDKQLEKTFIIHHTKKQGKGRKIKISKDKGATLRRLHESLADSKKTIAAFEIKKDLLAIEKDTLNDDFRKSTDIIHGDNSQEETVKEYIKNIDSLYTESDNLCYTGTLGTGIDLSKPHYEKRFGIFTGDVFAASDQCQQFSRYRPDCDSEIYCDTKKQLLKIDADQLVLDLINKNNESNAYYCENVKRLIEEGFILKPDGTFDEYNQAFLKLWGAINARKNASRSNPYQTLIDRLTDAGYELEFLDDSANKTENDAVLASQKATKTELNDKEDIAKADARILTDEEYIDAIRQKGNLDKEKQREVFKTRLAKTLGIPIDAGIVKLERTRKISTGLTLLHILLTDDESAIAFEMRDRKLNPVITDRSHYLKKRELLKKLQIPEFLAYLNAGNSYSKSSDWAKAIAKVARSNYKSMDSWLSIKIKFEKDKEGFKQSDTEIVGLILAKLGLLTTNEKSSGGDREREYQLDKIYWGTVLETILPYMNSRRPQQDDYLENQNTSEIFDPAHPERYRIPKFGTRGDVSEILTT